MRDAETILIRAVFHHNCQLFAIKKMPKQLLQEGVLVHNLTIPEEDSPPQGIHDTWKVTSVRYYASCDVFEIILSLNQYPKEVENPMHQKLIDADWGKRHWKRRNGPIEAWLR